MTDLSRLTSWHADWAGLNAVVLGAGMTGFSAADTLVELGAQVLVLATEVTPARLKMLEVIGATFVTEPDRAQLARGLPEELTTFSPEVIVVSPGYHPDHPILLWAAEHKIPVWGDIELAWRLRDKVGTPAEWLVVTGTNGKTTTVQLTAAILARAGYRVAPCGNIGVPVLDAIRDPQGFDVFVVEISSYQSHWMQGVTPFASAVLNVSEDHLDWHGSFEAYAEAKSKVYQNTQVACVYNKADAATEKMVEQAEVQEGARAIGFGLGSPGPSDLGVVDGILLDRAFLENRHAEALEIVTLAELEQRNLAVPHIVTNILAATALARAFGVSIEDVHDAVLNFQLDAHRRTVVISREGICWIDDSKATNVHAADASLAASASVVWIVGGLLKGVSLDDLIAKHAHRLRAAIVIGRERETVVAAFKRHAPDVTVTEVVPDETRSVMSQVVAIAREVARSGDDVLLAPAAASMDQFTDYAERGRLFAEAVLQQ